MEIRKHVLTVAFTIVLTIHTIYYRLRLGLGKTQSGKKGQLTINS
jgi:hypothetical protein